MSDGLNYFSAVLQHGAVSAMRDVEREHFIDEEELRTFDYITTFMRRHRTLPQIDTVATDCSVEFESVEEPVSYYRELLYDRKVYTTAQQPFYRLRAGLADMDAQNVREAVAELNAAVYQGRMRSDLQEIENADRNMMRRLEGRSSTILAEEGIITGLPPIDTDTGGYRNGDLIGWIGRPGLGKTYLMLYQALNAWISGRSVLFVSMEMPIDAITVRLAGLRSHVDSRAIRLNRLSNVALARVRDAVEQNIGMAPFHMFAGNFGRSVTDIATLMTELSPDVIFIDGIYRLLPSSAPKNTNRYERVAFVLDEVKGLTIEHDRPIVYTLQFNRGGADKSSLETIGYTDAAGQHSSLLYAIEPWVRHRENRVNLDVNESDVRVIKTMKGREGESAVFAMNYKFRPVDFSVNTDIYIGRPPDAVLAETAMENTNFMLPRGRR